MKEQVFFVINGNELMLDKVLVEYNEAPIFFVCRDEQRYFISSCADIEEERYLVAEVSLSQLSKMLHGKIAMRDLILQADRFWDIIVGEDMTKDIIAEREIGSIPLDALPYEGAYLKIVTKDLEEYTEKIDSVIYGGGTWEDKTPQAYKYEEMSILDLMGQYKVDTQYIYESVIKSNKKEVSSNNYQKAVYDRRISTSEIKLDNENEKINISIANSSKYLFAA